MYRSPLPCLKEYKRMTKREEDIDGLFGSPLIDSIIAKNNGDIRLAVLDSLRVGCVIGTRKTKRTLSGD